MLPSGLFTHSSKILRAVGSYTVVRAAYETAKAAVVQVTRERTHGTDKRCGP